jgi:hypothetical protein
MFKATKNTIIHNKVKNNERLFNLIVNLVNVNFINVIFKLISIEIKIKKIKDNAANLTKGGDEYLSS